MEGHFIHTCPQEHDVHSRKTHKAHNKLKTEQGAAGSVSNGSQVQQFQFWMIMVLLIQMQPVWVLLNHAQLVRFLLVQVLLQPETKEAEY